ncbi:MAG: IcfA [Nanohaloarchaea archaeon]|nr:IcfA [Candidatus Nanohaloarchaea archaeon]
MSDIETLLRSNLEHSENFEDCFDDLQDSQLPHSVTLCCSDSRVLQDHAWGNDQPGEIFTVSNIGNRTYQKTENGETPSGDVLYPVVHTDTDNIVVMGHTGCGAVTATYDSLTGSLEGEEPEGIEYCVGLLESRLEEGVDELPEGLERPEAINRLVEYNVDRQVEFLDESEEVPDDVNVYGVVYDFQDVYSGSRGEIHLINVDGENKVEDLKDSYPEVQDRVERLWEY